MSYVPVLWNRMNHDLDDLFHVMDADFQPMGWGFGRPMVRSAGRRRRPETSLADQKWTYSVKIGDFDPQHVKVKVENGKYDYMHVCKGADLGFQIRTTKGGIVSTISPSGAKRHFFFFLVILGKYT